MKNIIVELKKLTNSDDDLSIIVEISPDEAVIIGTRQAFINAAVKLLEIAGKSSTVDIDRDDLSEGPVDYTNYIKYAFNEFGDVWPVVAYIAKNQEQAETIKAHLKG